MDELGILLFQLMFDGPDPHSGGVPWQLEVPGGSVGKLDWTLTGSAGTATGKVVVLGTQTTFPGRKPGTEYWFVDAVVPTGIPRDFNLVVTSVGQAVSPFPPGPVVAESPIFPQSAPLTPADVPAHALQCATPVPGHNGQAGHAALYFEIVAAGGVQLPPTWYWTPFATTNLYGTETAKKTPTFASRVHMVLGPQPGAGYPSALVWKHAILPPPPAPPGPL